MSDNVSARARGHRHQTELVIFAMDQAVHMYLSNTNSEHYFPDNNGSYFRVKLSEPLHLHGEWEVALTSLTVSVSEMDVTNVLAGQVVEVYSNLVGLCIVGGDKRQILTRVNLGSPVVSAGSRTAFHVLTAASCRCFFKPIMSRNCSIVEIGLNHEGMYINDILQDSRVHASVY